MPAVYIEAPGQAPRVHALARAITSVGADPDNDIHVRGADLQPTHAQFVVEGDAVMVVGMLRDMVVNGRREKRKVLETGDVVRIGLLAMTYHADGLPKTEEEENASSTELQRAHGRLLDFSKRLLANAPTAHLVEMLLDGIIDITGADKGFLVLLEKGRPVVRAARHVENHDVQLSLEQLSDSILRRVMNDREPLVVSDARTDAQFNASESVVNLQLASVMCCPLLEREELQGLLYVGSHSAVRHFDEASLELMQIFAAQASLLLSQAQRIEELVSERAELNTRLDEHRLGRIVGACASMQEVFRRVRKVASTDISVLISGETGTGKELIAKEIHEASPRRGGPFVVINCGAIPENLLESELFGHVRGAFTGADRTRDGRFQNASGGTLFLDEIGEMPLPLQVKLLRALQERIVTKVGDATQEAVDIRVVAATNRRLDEEVSAGRFREDLYYRLDVVNVRLPPLRERGEDLEVLAKFFLARAAREHERPVLGFTKSCLVALRKYAWPGNVRELENRIAKAVVLAERELLTAADLDIQPEDLEEVLPLSEAKERFQTRYIDMVLQRNAGNRTKTAKELGVDPRTVFRHLEKRSHEPSPIPDEEGSAGALLGAEDLDPPGPR
ncbi:MAG: sigma 54-interacting transcriptional regulator [Myxococcota bacterium]